MDTVLDVCVREPIIEHLFGKRDSTAHAHTYGPLMAPQWTPYGPPMDPRYGPPMDPYGPPLGPRVGALLCAI